MWGGTVFASQSSHKDGLRLRWPQAWKTPRYKKLSVKEGIDPTQQDRVRHVKTPGDPPRDPPGKGQPSARPGPQHLSWLGQCCSNGVPYQQ